jgi:hypothetical protein
LPTTGRFFIREIAMQHAVKLDEWEFDEEVLKNLGALIDTMQSFDEILCCSPKDIDHFFGALRSAKVPINTKRRRDDTWIMMKVELIRASIAFPVSLHPIQIDALLRHVVNGTPIPEGIGKVLSH